MRKAIWFVALTIVIVGIILVLNGQTSKGREVPTIAITQIATHPALDEVRNGLIERLAEGGYKNDKVKIIFRNANGDASLTSVIAQEFARLKPNIVIPISTPSAIAVVREVRNIPIVFSGVTDPVGVGIVTSLENPEANVTGVSDRWPFEEQVRTFLRFFPQVRSIGMIYTRGDDVSEIGVKAIERLSKEIDFQLDLRPVSTAADIYPSARSLFGNVDAIYTGIDHLVLENMEGLVKASFEAQKPLFGGESGSVEKGAVLAVSINMTEFGRLTGDIVLKVLHGESPGDIPVATVRSGTLLVNQDAATQYKLDLDKLRAAGAKFVDTP